MDGAAPEEAGDARSQIEEEQPLRRAQLLEELPERRAPRPGGQSPPLQGDEEEQRERDQKAGHFLGGGGHVSHARLSRRVSARCALDRSGRGPLPSGDMPLLSLLLALAQDVPPVPSQGAHLAAAEAGDDKEDAAPEGIVSRASGRPDHPRSLEEIVKSGYLRVLTRNNDTSFFIYRGHRMGFDYELGKRLAQHLGIRVDMIVTQSWSEMVPALLKGEGDVIAAEVTVTEERKKQVLFAEPWGHTREVVVWKDGSPEIKSAEELSGKDVHVRRGSSYWQTLLELNGKLRAEGKPEIILQAAPDDWETDTILEAVSKGEIVYTVADELLANLHSAYWDNLVLGPKVSAERDLAWAVRQGDLPLKKAIDDVFREERRKPEFNVLRKKYFEAERTLKKERKDKFYASETGTLSAYDPLVRKYAEQHGFDWRLVAAQIYQESRFDPQRKSWVGAQGLLQIMPATAKGLGITDPTDPEQSIRGGLKYMQQLSDHYKDVVDPIDRYRFALAAYNTGLGHIDDARRLARRAGADATVWRNVAPWVLKLSDKKYASKARYGFCRGSEPVDYVRHIDERYAGYAQLVPLQSHRQ
ncbi:MAG: membrane-bound lytic murein transglycosylase MltF [Deltaproteobacteria bacterium]|nr:MAG: membrane-bound lytic murein transglycosylase MltF [Deltaproteobacteria bacterium]